MVERLLDVLRAVVVLEVVVGEEYLADLDAVLGEEALVLVDEARLPDRGAHLDVVDVRRTRLEPKGLDSGGHCTGRDEEDLVPRLAQPAELLDEALERRVVRLAGLVGDRVGSDFDYDSHRCRILYHLFRGGGGPVNLV